MLPSCVKLLSPVSTVIVKTKVVIAIVFGFNCY